MTSPSQATNLLNGVQARGDIVGEEQIKPTLRRTRSASFIQAKGSADRFPLPHAQTPKTPASVAASPNHVQA